MSKDWIAEAIKKPGALTATAKRAGKSISQLCSDGGKSGKTTQRCALAQTLEKMHKK